MTGEPERGDQSALPPTVRAPQLFREEALQRYVRAREFGDVLRLPPRWTRLAYPLVLGVALAASLMLVILPVGRNARGPAVVRVDGDASFVLVALLPASFIPELRPGMPLRVELAGYPQAGLAVAIEHLGDQAVGPAEARRALGTAAGEAVEIPGVVVLARATLPGATFRAPDGEHRFHDGMVASAEVTLGSEPLIVSLLPGLRTALAD